MALFNKNKKTREIKDDDSLIVKLWYNPRSHAAIVLGLYFIFFAIIIIVISTTDTKSVSNTSIKGSSINDMFLKLDNKDVLYNYVINEGNKKYYYSGMDKNDGVYGTILYNSDSYYIMVNNGECKVGQYNDKGEFIPAYSLCPENIKYNYFDYNYIYDLIKDVNGYKNEKENFYLFTLKDKTEVKITYENEYIKSINIKNNKFDYQLEYSFNEQDEQVDEGMNESL